jgi:hypothetical protein
MAKINDLNQAMQKFQAGANGTKTEFFALENDKDSAVVRFIHGAELAPEHDWMIVHQIELNGKKRWVECSQENDCPLCLSGNKPQLRLFLQVFDTRDGKLKIWERGQTFVPKILGLMNKYGSLIERPFEIQRFGKKGDTKTTYEIYPLDKDGKTATDFPPPSQVLGGFALKKSHDEMRAILAGDYDSSAPVIQPRGNGKGSDTF